jgi:AraC-like DNA-binding protein
VTGLVARFLVVELPPGTDVWGMQFRPGWAEPVLGVNPLVLPARLEPAGRLGRRLLSVVESLGRPLPPSAVGGTFHDAVAGLAADLAGPPPGGLVTDALRLLDATRGTIRMRQLGRELGASERSLHRYLSRAVGLPPKTYARIIRFRHAVEWLSRPGAVPPGGLSGAALALGFADQAHLTNEFRVLSGRTPAAILG